MSDPLNSELRQILISLIPDAYRTLIRTLRSSNMRKRRRTNAAAVLCAMVAARQTLSGMTPAAALPLSNPSSSFALFTRPTALSTPTHHVETSLVVRPQPVDITSYMHGQTMAWMPAAVPVPVPTPVPTPSAASPVPHSTASRAQVHDGGLTPRGRMRRLLFSATRSYSTEQLHDHSAAVSTRAVELATGVGSGTVTAAPSDDSTGSQQSNVATQGSAGYAATSTTGTVSDMQGGVSTPNTLPLPIPPPLPPSPPPPQSLTPIHLPDGEHQEWTAGFMLVRHLTLTTALALILIGSLMWLVGGKLYQRAPLLTCTLQLILLLLAINNCLLSAWTREAEGGIDVSTSNGIVAVGLIFVSLVMLGGVALLAIASDPSNRGIWLQSIVCGVVLGSILNTAVLSWFLDLSSPSALPLTMHLLLLLSCVLCSALVILYTRRSRKRAHAIALSTAVVGGWALVRGCVMLILLIDIGGAETWMTDKQAAQWAGAMPIEETAAEWKWPNEWNLPLIDLHHPQHRSRFDAEASDPSYASSLPYSALSGSVTQDKLELHIPVAYWLYLLFFVLMSLVGMAIQSVRRPRPTLPLTMSRDPSFTRRSASIGQPLLFGQDGSISGSNSATGSRKMSRNSSFTNYGSLSGIDGGSINGAGKDALLHGHPVEEDMIGLYAFSNHPTVPPSSASSAPSGRKKRPSSSSATRRSTNWSRRTTFCTDATCPLSGSGSGSGSRTGASDASSCRMSGRRTVGVAVGRSPSAPSLSDLHENTSTPLRPSRRQQSQSVSGSGSLKKKSNEQRTRSGRAKRITFALDDVSIARSLEPRSVHASPMAMQTSGMQIAPFVASPVAVPSSAAPDSTGTVSVTASGIVTPTPIPAWSSYPLLHSHDEQEQKTNDNTTAPQHEETNDFAPHASLT